MVCHIGIPGLHRVLYIEYVEVYIPRKGKTCQFLFTLFLELIHHIFVLAEVTVGFGRTSATFNESDGQFTMCVVKDRETAVPVEFFVEDIPNTATKPSGKDGTTDTIVYSS